MSTDNTELVQTRVTLDEKEAIATKIEREGISEAAYLRRLIKQDLSRKEKK